RAPPRRDRSSYPLRKLGWPHLRGCWYFEYWYHELRPCCGLEADILVARKLVSRLLPLAGRDTLRRAVRPARRNPSGLRTLRARRRDPQRGGMQDAVREQRGAAEARVAGQVAERAAGLAHD